MDPQMSLNDALRCTVALQAVAMVTIELSTKGPIDIDDLGPESPWGVAMLAYASAFATAVVNAGRDRDVLPLPPMGPELN